MISQLNASDAARALSARTHLGSTPATSRILFCLTLLCLVSCEQSRPVSSGQLELSEVEKPLSTTSDSESKAQSAPPPSPRLTRVELNHKLSRLIHEPPLRFNVVYQDILGEGDGGWDPDPRYPDTAVNCITWLHWMLAELYSFDGNDKLAVMDQIRYYGGEVAFGLRKHYTDRWMGLEPEPLRPVTLSCQGLQAQTITVEPQTFTKNHRYPCGLYEEDKTTFSYTMIQRSHVDECLTTLDDGYYVMFAVSSDAYLRRYGQLSGPMGQVHTLIVEKPSLREDEDISLYHASTAARDIKHENPASYFHRMRNLHRGYVIYELDPTWDPFAPSKVNQDEVTKIQDCESGHAQQPGRRTLSPLPAPKPQGDPNEMRERAWMESIGAISSSDNLP